LGVATPLRDFDEARLASLRSRFDRLRGDPASPPAVSVIVPVNAKEDLDTVMGVVGDTARYAGPHTLEVVLVVNNYPPDEPPAALGAYEAAGLRTVAIPSAWTEGEVVSFSARLPGVRAAASDRLVLWDADCRVPNPSALIDWYVDQLASGATAAYTHVDYYDLLPLWSVRARIAIHHAARWTKRAVLRVPTLRGSNYAIRRDVLLRLHADGLVGDDLNIGPAVRAGNGRCAYSRRSQLSVFTSGRRFKGGWRKLAHYLRYRLSYNLRVLPVSNEARQARARYHAQNHRQVSR
jgi:hypothetical protein